MATEAAWKECTLQADRQRNLIMAGDEVCDTVDGEQLLQRQGVVSCFHEQPSRAGQPLKFCVGPDGKREREVISQTNTRSSLASDHNKWGTGMRQQQPAKTAQDTA